MVVDARRSAASVSSSSPLGEIKKEILSRAQNSRKVKNKTKEVTVESKVEREVLIDILIDLGHVGGALQNNVARLSGSTVSDLASWILQQKEKDIVFSGLSHFRNTTDPIPHYTESKSAYEKSLGLGLKRSSDKLEKVLGNTNITGNSTTKPHGKMDSRTANLPGSNNSSQAKKGNGREIKPVNKSGMGVETGTIARNNKSPEGLKSRGAVWAERKIDAQRSKGDKKLQVITEDYSDEADGDDCRCAELLSPVREPYDDSSGYSSSSQALSDSEEDVLHDMRGDSGSDSGDDIHLHGSGRNGNGPHSVNTIFEEDEEYSSEDSDTSPIANTRSAPNSSASFSAPHVGVYKQHSIKSESDLAKIEEEDEVYSDIEEEEEEEENEGERARGNEERTFLDPHSGFSDWKNWTDALESGSRDRMWLYRSLVLIAELCRGNFRAQKKAAHFLPPELLITLLRTENLGDENRYVRNIDCTYVHDCLTICLLIFIQKC